MRPVNPEMNQALNYSRILSLSFWLITLVGVQSRILLQPAIAQDESLINCIKRLKDAGVKADTALMQCSKPKSSPLLTPTPLLNSTPQSGKTSVRVAGESPVIWLTLTDIPPERRKIVEEYARSFNFDNNLKYAESLENIILAFSENNLSKEESRLIIEQANQFSSTKLERVLAAPLGLRKKIKDLFDFKYPQYAD